MADRRHWDEAVALGSLRGTAEDLARYEELIDRLGRIRDEEREVLAELRPLVFRLRGVGESAGGRVEREALAQRAMGPLRVSMAGARKWFARMEGASGAGSDGA